MLDRKTLFERSLWQRTEILKILERLSEVQWQQGHLESVFINAFEIVRSEWEHLELLEGRHPTIVNDDDLDGDPAAEIPAHALTLVWLRSRDGQISLWRQNEARKADLLMRYDELDLDQRIEYMVAPIMPQLEDSGQEIRLTLANVIDLMWQPLTVGIRGLRFALGELGFRPDLDRIFTLPHEGPHPGPSVEIGPWSGEL